MPSRWVAEAINTLSGGDKYKQGMVSPTPDQLDYLVGQVTGGIGRELSKAATTGTAIVTGEELPAHKIPLLGRFYGDTTNQSSQGARFYDNLKRLNEIKDGLEGRMKDKLPTAQFKRDNPEVAIIGMSSSAQHEVAQLRKEKLRLVEKGAAKEEVKRIEVRITGVMKRLNDNVKSLQK